MFLSHHHFSSSSLSRLSYYFHYFYIFCHVLTHPLNSHQIYYIICMTYIRPFVGSKDVILKYWIDSMTYMPVIIWLYVANACLNLKPAGNWERCCVRKFLS